MQKRLSHSLTFIWKIIFPIVWVVGFPLATMTEILNFNIVSLILLGFFFLGSLFIYYNCLKAKKVHIDDEFLYVSNFIKTIQIPIENIKKVNFNPMLTPRLIYIEFKTETEFGNDIVFLGYSEMFHFSSIHPAVKEIESRMLVNSQAVL